MELIELNSTRLNRKHPISNCIHHLNYCLVTVNDECCDITQTAVELIGKQSTQELIFGILVCQHVVLLKLRYMYLGKINLTLSNGRGY